MLSDGTKDPLDVAFGLRLRKFREARKWGTALLARKIVSTQTAIGRWENGEGSCDLVTKMRLVDVLGIGFHELNGFRTNDEMRCAG